MRLPASEPLALMGLAILALVKGGRARIGETLYAPLEFGRTIPCQIADPVFFDPEGERLSG